MNNLYYVFKDEKTAINAEASICEIAGAPRTGRNALTGKLEPYKCKTERWAIPKQRLDGKWVFPIIPTKMLEPYQLSVINNFKTSFPYILEEYDVNWFPIEDEIYLIGE